MPGALLHPPPVPASRLEMGICASAPDDGAVHASEAMPAVKAPPSEPGTPPAATQPPARAAKRGAVGEAEQAAHTEDTIEALPKHVKTEAESALITSAIADNILFRDLQEPELQALVIGALTPLTVAAGEVVIQQGARGGDTFYVVQSGSCEVVVDGKAVAVRGCGSAFGELALLYSCPRAATVRATETTLLWVLHQRWYRLVARSAAQLRVAQKVSLLRKVSFFAGLAPQQLEKVAESLAAAEYPPGASVIVKGGVGDSFYLLRSGTVVVSDGVRELSRIGAGGFFGERALLKDDVRAAHVTVALDACCAAVCYALSRDNFKAALAMVEETFRVEALRGMALLSPLQPAQLVTAAAAMERMELHGGEAVVAKGAQLDGIYVVEEGEMAVSDAEAGCAWPATLPRGYALGAASLGAGGEASGAALAAGGGGARVLHLRRATFEQLFGTLEEVTAASRIAALRRVPLLAGLPPDALLALSRELEAVSCADGALVVRQGDQGDAFYMLEAGAVVVLDAQGKEVARLQEGAYFGELALLKDDVRKATVVARGPIALLTMKRASFQRMREAFPAVADGLSKGEASYAPISFSARIGLCDVKLARSLGVGTFGKVWLATYKGSPYALKQIAKAQVVKKGLVAHVKRERDVMAECAASKFLVAMSASFQDEQHLYLMMELISGGELFYYLQSLSVPLAESSARFYVACVVEAFSFLHSRFYIYRDLKPENLLICANGYLKVADFSFVKRLRAGKTHTLCGTPAYLAPEQITRAGHDRAVDWWALGVLTYEMLAGASPFYSDDDMVMFKRIVDVKYSFLPPVQKMSYEAKDLVNALLQKASHQRLPMGRRGVAGLYEHVWFKGFNWEGFREGKLKASYVPKLRGGEDLRFFPDCAEETPGSEYGKYTSVGNFVGFESS